MSDVVLRRSALDEVVATVGRARPALVDPWEATALIESFGYTDARVSRDIGMADTSTLGAYVFHRLADRAVVSSAPSVPAAAGSMRADLLDSLVTAVVAAAPWVLMFGLGRYHPEVLAMPGHAAVPLTLALMLSLIAGGGFAQAIRQGGRYYLDQEQPRLASWLCGYMLRLGATLAVAVGAAAVLAGAAFNLAPWPYLVLFADEFIVLTVMWISCAVIGLRGERWRALTPLAAFAAAFVAARTAGADALIAQFAGAGLALATALVQLPSVFAVPRTSKTTPLPLPWTGVLLYRALPFAACGSLYFAFLFADRLAGSGPASAFTGEPFGAATGARLGMDLALLTLVIGGFAIDYADRWFARRLKTVIRTATAIQSAAAARRLHARALGIAAAGFAGCALLMAAGSHMALPGALAAAWQTLFLADAGYLLLAIGTLNALVLLGFDRPAPAVQAFAAALAVNIALLVIGRVVAVEIGPAALIAGGLWLAAHSTMAVWDALRRSDYTLAVAGAGNEISSSAC